MASTSDQALHRAITARLLLETAAVLLGLGGLAVAVAHEPALPRPLVALEHHPADRPLVAAEELL
ncbi:MAG: hypothetical protein KC420_09625, partial [Myxococcales bacterium]|nr:hypothetical protein [Myxococcales bacterium]